MGKISGETVYDTVVIGGAAASLTAGIYAARRAMKTLIIAKSIGGQAVMTDVIENYPGFLSVGGVPLMNKMLKQAIKAGAEVIYEEVNAVEEAPNANDGKPMFSVKTTAPNTYKTKSVILSYGKTPRTLDVSGEGEFGAKGVSYCVTCLPSDSDVIVNNSLRPISEIKQSDLILTHDGSFKPVIKTVKRRYAGDLVRIKTRFFRESDVKLTPNHPVLATKLHKGPSNNYWNFIWEQPEWVSAGNLTEKHILLYPIITDIIDKRFLNITRLGFPIGTEVVSYKKPTYASHSIPSKIPVNREFMRLAGYFLSDGCTTSRGINIYLQKGQENYADDIVKIVENLFGIKASVKVAENVLRIGVYSVLVGKLFGKLFGKYSYNKSIPHWMIFLPNAKQKELIKGIWRGDGYNAEKHFSITTNSKKLCAQIKSLFLRLDIIPSVEKIPLEKLKPTYINGRRIEFKHDKYQLLVGGPFLESMSKILGVKHRKIESRKRMAHHAWIRGGYVYLPIRQIKKERYNGEVYNLVVAENNTYVTTNSIVHNCDGPLFKGKSVAVVGGGNSALEGAEYLSKICPKVYLIHRRDQFRGFEYLIEEVKKRKNIEILYNSVVKEIKGKNTVHSIIVQNVSTKVEKELTISGVFVEIGSVTKTEFIKHLVKLDQLGQVIVSNNGETFYPDTEDIRPGVFAAGDLTQTPFKQIVVSAGEGCKAALQAYNYLVGQHPTFVADWVAKKKK